MRECKRCFEVRWIWSMYHYKGFFPTWLCNKCAEEYATEKKNELAKDYEMPE